MFQALVKMSPRSQGSVHLAFPSQEARYAYIRQPGVWWYYFPENDDGWLRGGAWNVPAGSQEEADEMRQVPRPEDPDGDDDEESRW